jgi:hypothetical protein
MDVERENAKLDVYEYERDNANPADPSVEAEQQTSEVAPAGPTDAGPTAFALACDVAFAMEENPTWCVCGRTATGLRLSGGEPGCECNCDCGRRCADCDHGCSCLRCKPWPPDESDDDGGPAAVNPLCGTTEPTGEIAGGATEPTGENAGGATEPTGEIAPHESLALGGREVGNTLTEGLCPNCGDHNILCICEVTTADTGGTMDVERQIARFFGIGEAEQETD